MKPSQHVSEEDLIAYYMHESSEADAVRAHLDSCSECAALSESIAQTLRVFSAEPVPEPPVERQWQRLRGELKPYTPVPRHEWRFKAWLRPGLAFATAAIVLVGMGMRTRHPVHTPAVTPTDIAMRRPGPLSTMPHDPAITQQLDSAERLLTVVSHTRGSLDENSRAQAHALRLKNAFFIDQARASGDQGTAAVLEDLDHVLTNMDHDEKTVDKGVHLRVEMSTKGLLLDLRILRQNAEGE